MVGRCKSRLSLLILASHSLLAGCQNDPPSFEQKVELTQQEASRVARIKSHPYPSQRLVSVIEEKIDGMACVERLTDWERVYFYHTGYGGEIDNSRVDFILKRGPEFGVVPGIKVVSPLDIGHMGHQKVDLAYGVYTITSDSVELKTCGPNV